MNNQINIREMSHEELEAELGLKPKYFVFLDIDGTLWDQQTAVYFHGPYADVQKEPHFNPKSVAAINTLLASLEEQFDTTLVVTSGRRQNLAKCTEYLHREGVKYDKPIFCTPYTAEGSRGSKIIGFMNKEGYGPFTYPTIKNVLDKMLYNFKNSDYQNYVVLEDQRKKISNEIPPARRIITNIKRGSLSPDDVIVYLKSNNIPLVGVNEHGETMKQPQQ